MNKILLFDDSPAIRDQVQNILEDAGYVVKSYAMWDDEPVDLSSFDLVITDDRMPGENGQEVAAIIREVGHTMPIILMSNGTTEDDVRGLIEGGVISRFFSKRGLMDSPTELLDLVRGLIK